MHPLNSIVEGHFARVLPSLDVGWLVHQAAPASLRFLGLLDVRPMCPGTAMAMTTA